jgi:hypothetical protein
METGLDLTAAVRYDLTASRGFGVDFDLLNGWVNDASQKVKAMGTRDEVDFEKETSEWRVVKGEK